jgi:hypothetical protein
MQRIDPILGGGVPRSLHDRCVRDGRRATPRWAGSSSCPIVPHADHSAPPITQPGGEGRMGTHLAPWHRHRRRQPRSRSACEEFFALLPCISRGPSHQGATPICAPAFGSTLLVERSGHRPRRAVLRPADRGTVDIRRCPDPAREPARRSSQADRVATSRRRWRWERAHTRARRKDRSVAARRDRREPSGCLTSASDATRAASQRNQHHRGVT